MLTHLHSTHSVPQFLKAVRLRVEMRWAAADRQRRCECPPADLEAGDKCCQPSNGSDKAVAVPKPACCGGGSAAVEGGDAASGSGSDAVPTSSRPKYWLRTSGNSSSDRALVVGGYQLITRGQVRGRAGHTGGRIFGPRVQCACELPPALAALRLAPADPPAARPRLPLQAVKNFWRGCFTFVVIFLDYGGCLAGLD